MKGLHIYSHYYIHTHAHIYHIIFICNIFIYKVQINTHVHVGGVLPMNVSLYSFFLLIRIIMSYVLNTISHSKAMIAVFY